jgi:hypothetical protein
MQINDIDPAILADLQSFDTDDFKPADRNAYRCGIDVLQEGNHDFAVQGGEFRRAKDSAIFALVLRSETQNTICERTYWLNRKEEGERLAADLMVLGFDTDQWQAPARPFSKEFLKVVPQLPGIRFKGTKKTNPNKNDPAKVYHNLYVNARLPGTGAVGTSAPPSHPEMPANHDDIPF